MIQRASNASRTVPSSLLFIDVVGLTQINDTHGRSGDQVLRHVARQPAGLRVADILFRCSSDEFVALLDDTGAETGRLLRRIREIFSPTPWYPQRPSILIDVSVTTVSAPDDGASLAHLIAAAHLRASTASPGHEGSTVH